MDPTIETNKKPHHFKGNLLIVILVVIFVFLSFYVFEVHIPYSSHQDDLNNAREAILKKYKYHYGGSFYQYNGASTYYIMSIKNKNTKYYGAFDEKYNLVDTYNGKLAGNTAVANAIYKKYKLHVHDIHICYEDGAFMYYVKYQSNNNLYYFFYSIDHAAFIKSYNL